MKINNKTIQRSYDLALKIIKIYKYLNRNNDCILAKHLLRSGTAIGENIISTQHCVSKKNFKLKILEALKEAKKTKYWLHLLIESGFIVEKEVEDIEKLLDEIISTLVKMSKNEG